MRRKHRSQMDDEEVCRVENFIHNTDWNTSKDPHLLDRMQSKGIAIMHINHVLRFGSLIEVNYEAKRGLRALLRCAINNKDYCVVVAFKDSVVITAWKNNPEDLHYTLDPSLYNWQVNLNTIILDTRHASML